MATTVVLYDGVCGLCNGFVQFVLRRDREGRVLFAPLQGSTARAALAPRGLDPSDLDTIYVVADWRSPQERVLAHSRAVLYTLAQLGGGWPFLAGVGDAFPRPLSDAVYRFVARRRYRRFGRLEACPVPPSQWRERFLK